MQYMHEDFHYLDFESNFTIDYNEEYDEILKNYINSPDIKRVIFEHLIDSGDDITNITLDKIFQIAVTKIL